MYLKPKELKNYVNTIADGTRENPKVEKLPWNYKLPLYLGYTLKWDYYWQTKTEYSPQYRSWYEWEIKPKFKLSHASFNCRWDYNSWDFLMEVLLPKIQDDGLLNQTIVDFILSFDKKSLIIECMNIINKEVSDMDYPFVNIKEGERFENFNEEYTIY